MNNTSTSPLANGSADKLTAKAGDYVGQAANVAHRNVDKLAEAGHPAIDRVSAQAHGAIDAAESTANQAVGVVAGASRTVAQGVGKVKDAHQRTVDATREHVRDSPLVAVALATGIGYLVGRLIRSR